MFKRHQLIILLACLAIAVHCNTMTGGFITDDFDNIVNNRAVQSLRFVPGLFSEPIVNHATSQYYRPIFSLSLALDHSLWGSDPSGYHVTNIILHLFATLLVFFLAEKLLRSTRAAFLAALIFSVHPVHSEAVAWISARNEPLWTIFIMLAMYLYLLYRQKRKLWQISFSVTFFVLALLSKETAVVFPGIILAYEACFSRDTIRVKLPAILAYIIPLAGYFVLRAAMLDTPFGDTQPLMMKLFTSMVILKEYFHLLIFPAHLKTLYRETIQLQSTLLNRDVLISGAVLTAIVTGSVLLAKKEKMFAFALIWVFLTVLPASGLVTIIRVSPMADRYLYAPSIGFAMFMALLFCRMTDDIDKKTFITVAHITLLMIVCGLFLRSFLQNAVWKDNITYLRQMVKDAPNYYEAHNGLGIEYMLAGDYAGAERSLLKAAALSVPETYRVHLNLGTLYTKQGKFTEAERSFDLVLRHERSFAALAHHNLGLLYMQQRKNSDTEKHFKLALMYNKRFAGSYLNLGALYLSRGNYADAERMLQEAIEIDPAYAEAYFNLAVLYQKKGDLLKAETAFLNAVKHDSKNNKYLYATGLFYFDTGRTGQAKQYFERVIALAPGHADSHNNLGIIALKEGNRDEAAAYFSTAVGLSPGNTGFKANLDKTLQLQ